jgi:hypothetical protein
LEPSASLVTGAFVDDVEDWLPRDVENINNNGAIEAYVLTEVEFKPTRRLAIALAVLTVLSEIFKCLLIDDLASTFQDLLEPRNRWMTESTV